MLLPPLSSLIQIYYELIGISERRLLSARWDKDELYEKWEAEFSSMKKAMKETPLPLPSFLCSALKFWNSPVSLSNSTLCCSFLHCHSYFSITKKISCNESSGRKLGWQKMVRGQRRKNEWMSDDSFRVEFACIYFVPLAVARLLADFYVKLANCSRKKTCCESDLYWAV